MTDSIYNVATYVALSTDLLFDTIFFVIVMACLNPVAPSDNLHTLTQTFVKLFKHQRSKVKHRSQFAVVYLSPIPLRDISVENTSFCTQEGVVSAPGEATEWTSPTFPPEDNCFNYMTPRPTTYSHAEVLLMEKFEELFGSYRRSSIFQCATIVLYSWLHPCLACTEKIIETLEECIRSTMCEVIMIYSCEQKGLEDRDEIHSRFEQAEIRLQQERSDQYIQRASRKDC